MTKLKLHLQQLEQDLVTYENMRQEANKKERQEELARRELQHEIDGEFVSYLEDRFQQFLTEFAHLDPIIEGTIGHYNHCTIRFHMIDKGWSEHTREVAEVRLRSEDQWDPNTETTYHLEINHSSCTTEYFDRPIAIGLIAKIAAPMKQELIDVGNEAVKRIEQLTNSFTNDRASKNSIQLKIRELKREIYVTRLRLGKPIEINKSVEKKRWNDRTYEKSSVLAVRYDRSFEKVVRIKPLSVSKSGKTANILLTYLTPIWNDVKKQTEWVERESDWDRVQVDNIISCLADYEKITS